MFEKGKGKWLKLFSKKSSDIETQSSKQNNDYKCYITISSTSPRGEFNIEEFLNGSMDSLFAPENKSDQPSPFFNTKCKCYETLNSLFAYSHSTARGCTENGIYILVSPFDENTVRRYAAEGKLSQAIEKAFNYFKILDNGKNEAALKKIAGLENKHFVSVHNYSASKPSS
jgi:hypothetical protein